MKKKCKDTGNNKKTNLDAQAKYTYVLEKTYTRNKNQFTLILQVSKNTAHNDNTRTYN